jgi:hypothetical protein
MKYRSDLGIFVKRETHQFSTSLESCNYDLQKRIHYKIWKVKEMQVEWEKWYVGQAAAATGLEHEPLPHHNII